MSTSCQYILFYRTQTVGGWGGGGEVDGRGWGGSMPFAFGDHMKTFNQFVNELRKPTCHVRPVWDQLHAV